MWVGGIPSRAVGVQGGKWMAAVSVAEEHRGPARSSVGSKTCGRSGFVETHLHASLTSLQGDSVQKKNSGML